MTLQLTTSEKIKIALGRKNMTLQDLATALGTTRQNLHNKLTRGNFKEDDLKQIAEALGAQLSISLIFEDGTEI